VVSVGAGLRIGINTFSVLTNDIAAADLSGTGVGIGANLGLMLRPHPMVQIGAVYRTPMSVSISGNGDVSTSQTKQDFGLHVTWPQSAGLGVSVTPIRRLMVTAQVDWTGWSSVQSLDLTVGGIAQPKAMRYQDSYAIHFGLQGVLTRFMLLRLGWAWDSNAIPDRTLRRENIDSDKSTLALGLGFHFWRIFIDAAVEALLPLGERTIAAPAVSSTLYGQENEPGRYDARVYSAELSAQIRF
jgi:long-chain fatty acid transport protein